MSHVIFQATNVDGGVQLCCNVVGYQFPEIAHDDWCQVCVDVRQGEDSFHKIDPALDATDLRSIRDWFSALARNNLPRFALLSFVEPCLSFEFLGCNDAGVRFAIHLGAELKPNFQLKQLSYESKKWGIVFHLEPWRLAAVVTMLEEASGIFPPRRTMPPSGDP